MVYKITRASIIPTEQGIYAPIKEVYKVDDSGKKISENKFAINQEKEEKYDIFSDPSHAWLKVKYSELKELGIADKISSYSYKKGDYVYLEEDSDLTLFVNAKKEKGEKVIFNEHNSDESSIIRTYSRY